MQLEQIGDLERLIGKVAVGRVTPRELVTLRGALAAIEPVKRICVESGEDAIVAIGEQLAPCATIRERIARTLEPDAPSALNRGPVIRAGVDAELDELRQIAYSGKDYLMKLQVRESEATGITSLKIGYNNVFGYYIEVTNTHKSKVPDSWIRKQTLVNAERYITPELKEYEEKILGAQEKIAIIETRLYNELVAAVAEYIHAIQLNANLLARLDCLMALTRVALENKYNRPVVDDSLSLSITEGRHPVIEKQLPIGEKYIANDVMLDSTTQQVIIITGPNMAGKSALLRQTGSLYRSSLCILL